MARIIPPPPAQAEPDLSELLKAVGRVQETYARPLPGASGHVEAVDGQDPESNPIHSGSESTGDQ